MVDNFLTDGQGDATLACQPAVSKQLRGRCRMVTEARLEAVERRAEELERRMLRVEAAALDGARVVARRAGAERRGGDERAGRVDAAAALGRAARAPAGPRGGCSARSARAGARPRAASRWARAGVGRRRCDPRRARVALRARRLAWLDRGGRADGDRLRAVRGPGRPRCVAARASRAHRGGARSGRRASACAPSRCRTSARCRGACDDPRYPRRSSAAPTIVSASMPWWR
jgi:hypothetical protein